jgi:hypothetical protein
VPIRRAYRRHRDLVDAYGKVGRKLSPSPPDRGIESSTGGTAMSIGSCFRVKDALDAYLARIGFTGDALPDLDT